MKPELKKIALKLRKRGYSFREISKIIHVSKSTASLWTRSVFLDEKANIRLNKLTEQGRWRGKITNQRKKDILLERIKENCNVLKTQSRYSKDDYKLFLALLYWGEGAKAGSQLSFINSDPEMIKAYLNLLRKSFVVSEEKFHVWLHLHEYHNRKIMLGFWSDITGIPKNSFSVYNKPHTGKNKKPGYMGCLSIRYGDSKILKEIFIIIERFKFFANIAGLV